MKQITRAAAALLLITLTAIGYSFTTRNDGPVKPPVNTEPKIQVAILLDVSGSMDGLIEQAKAQLWNMVSTMGKAQCNKVAPKIEIALYEYGRTNNDVAAGYVKQISGFSSDLDQLSKELFALKTNGGDEFCGQVMYTSLTQLNWEPDPLDYKVIFIAGNEDFLQGSVHYSKACEEAKKKGVIINTIYCGDKQQGIREHWNLSGECGGNGSFTNIDQNEKPIEIPTPYDSTIFVLNDKLNKTYIGYGSAGASGYAKQAEMDQMNLSVSKSAAVKRAAVKGQKGLYDNSGWDLVDAYNRDSTLISKVDLKTLPVEYKNKSRAEIKKIVVDNNKERGAIQKEIAATNDKREAYIAKEKAKNAVTNKATLETEVERIIKEQARRYNMVIQ